LDAAADHAPTAPAVTVDGARFTYQQLRQEAQDVARGLTALGVGEGDRVTLHMTNSRELLASYYGCFRLGAIACPLNVRLTLAELRPMLDTIGPVVAFVELAGAPAPADVAAIAATAASALADYKVPEKVEVVEKLPRTAAGKIDRAALRGWARSADHTAELSDSAQPDDYAPVQRNPRTRRKDAP